MINMAIADTPEYSSYIRLCRELNLKRKFQTNDLWTQKTYLYHLVEDEQVRNDEPVWNVKVWPGDWLPGMGDIRPSGGDGIMVWLPTLADWLDMLEKAGRDHFEIWHSPKGYQADIPGRIVELMTAVPTREEAAAKLWTMVTKLVVEKV